MVCVGCRRVAVAHLLWALDTTPIPTGHTGAERGGEHVRPGILIIDAGSLPRQEWRAASSHHSAPHRAGLGGGQVVIYFGMTSFLVLRCNHAHRTPYPSPLDRDPCGISLGNSLYLVRHTNHAGGMLYPRW